jgi:hypothetical protein
MSKVLLHKMFILKAFRKHILLFHQDGGFLTVNSVSNDLSKLTQIPRDLLLKVNIGRCANTYKIADCSIKGLRVADFNMWDSALSDRTIGNWTGCRQVLVNQYIVEAVYLITFSIRLD